MNLNLRIDSLFKLRHFNSNFSHISLVCFFTPLSQLVSIVPSPFGLVITWSWHQLTLIREIVWRRLRRRRVESDWLSYFDVSYVVFEVLLRTLGEQELRQLKATSTRRCISLRSHTKSRILWWDRCRVFWIRVLIVLEDPVIVVILLLYVLSTVWTTLKKGSWGNWRSSFIDCIKWV